MSVELEMESYGLEELHQSLLKALEKIDSLCRNHNISYSLYGGTLLGAERNHKFIPWDDDVDLCMSRDQYEKLLEVISNLNDSSCKIEKTSLWVPRFIYRDEEQTVFVDIFIWDYISEIKWQRWLKINLLRFTQGMMKRKVDYRKYGAFQRLLLFVSHNFGKLFSGDFKRKVYEFISMRVFVGKRQYVHCSNEIFQAIQFVYDIDYIEKYIDIEFEGKKFMANHRYKESLINLYGEDYLTPPPKEKRCPAHQGMIHRINNNP